MSSTEHLRGLLRKVSGDVNKFAEYVLSTKGTAWDDTVYDIPVEQLTDEYGDYVLVGEDLYEVLSKEELDPDNDIFKVKVSDNFPDIFDYEVKYYNGGGSFGEAIAQAFTDMEKKNAE